MKSLNFFLPSQNYNGKLKSLEEFYKEQRHQLETEYREWLIDSSNLKQLPKEKKTDKKTSIDANANNTTCDSPNEPLSKLSLD